MSVGWRVLALTAVAVLTAAILFVAYALLARLALHGEVTNRSLARSVALASDTSWSALDGGRCRALRADGAWRCTVADAEASGSVTYRVDVRDGSSCWRARMVSDGAEGEMPRRVGDCVHRWQWSIWDAAG